MKRLKMPKVYSKAVNRRTATAMAKRKGQMDKQRSTKHYTENKRSSNTNPTKTGSELVYHRKVGNSCSACDTSRVTLVTIPVINHKWGKTGF